MKESSKKVLEALRRNNFNVEATSNELAVSGYYISRVMKYDNEVLAILKQEKGWNFQDIKIRHDLKSPKIKNQVSNNNTQVEILQEVKQEAKQEIIKAENRNFCLSVLIPQSNEEYIEREIDNRIAFWADNTEKSILLSGEAGSGKTYSVIEYARRRQKPLLIIPCENSQILRELLGFYTVENQKTVYNEGLLSKILQTESVVLFDEVNSMNASGLFMLHELIQNRRLFVKDAPEEKQIINVNEKCNIFLAMNPCNSKYLGTNKLNIALVNRLIAIDFPDFEIKDFEKIVKTKDKETDKLLLQFFDNARQHIKNNDIRSIISIRNIKSIQKALELNATLQTALKECFLNNVLITAGREEAKSLTDLARITFGIEI